MTRQALRRWSRRPAPRSRRPRRPPDPSHRGRSLRRRAAPGRVRPFAYPGPEPMTDSMQTGDDLAALAAETEAALAAAPDLRVWDAIRVATLGRNGALTGLLKGLGGIPAEARKERGAALNRLKATLETAIEARRAALEAAALDARLL